MDGVHVSLELLVERPLLSVVLPLGWLGRYRRHGTSARHGKWHLRKPLPLLFNNVQAHFPRSGFAKWPGSYSVLYSTPKWRGLEGIWAKLFSLVPYFVGRLCSEEFPWNPDFTRNTVRSVFSFLFLVFESNYQFPARSFFKTSENRRHALKNNFNLPYSHNAYGKGIIGFTCTKVWNPLHLELKIWQNTKTTTPK